MHLQSDSCCSHKSVKHLIKAVASLNQAAMDAFSPTGPHHACSASKTCVGKCRKAVASLSELAAKPRVAQPPPMGGGQRSVERACDPSLHSPFVCVDASLFDLSSRHTGIMQSTIARQSTFSSRAAGVKSAPRVAKACIMGSGSGSTAQAPHAVRSR